MSMLYYTELHQSCCETVWFLCAVREVGEAVGANAGVPAEGISKEDAHWHSIWPDWAIDVFALNNAASSAKAQKDLGWTHVQTGMLQDIACGSYAQIKT